MSYYLIIPHSSAAFFTNLVPFSLFEAGIISFFAILVAILYRRYLLPSPRQLSEIAAAIFAVVFIAYTVTLGIPTTVVRSYTSTEDFADNDVIYAVHRLAEDLNLDFPTEKISVSEIYPTLLCDVRKYAREALGVKFAIIPRAKESLISAVLGRMGTQAYYCFFSGETVYDPEMPLPLAIFSIAHETMHFLGISREDEANFHAVRLCMASENATVRYSGALAAYRYISSAICEQSREGYITILKSLSAEVRSSVLDCSEFATRYKKTAVRKIADNANSVLVRARYMDGEGAYSDTARRMLEYLIAKYR